MQELVEVAEPQRALGKLDEIEAEPGDDHEPHPLSARRVDADQPCGDRHEHHEEADPEDQRGGAGKPQRGLGCRPGRRRGGRPPVNGQGRQAAQAAHRDGVSRPSLKEGPRRGMRRCSCRTEAGAPWLNGRARGAWTTTKGRTPALLPDGHRRTSPHRGLRCANADVGVQSIRRIVRPQGIASRSRLRKPCAHAPVTRTAAVPMTPASPIIRGPGRTPPAAGDPAVRALARSSGEHGHRGVEPGPLHRGPPRLIRMSRMRAPVSGSWASAARARPRRPPSWAR